MLTQGFPRRRYWVLSLLVVLVTMKDSKFMTSYQAMVKSYRTHVVCYESHVFLPFHETGTDTGSVSFKLIIKGRCTLGNSMKFVKTVSIEIETQ